MQSSAASVTNLSRSNSKITYRAGSPSILAPSSVQAPASNDPPETTVREYRAYWLYGAGLAASGGIGRLVGLFLIDDLVKGAGVYEQTSLPCSGPSPVNGTTPNCVLPIGGSYINTVSYLGFVATVAVIIQIFVLLGLSAFGDYGFYRRSLLIITGVVGAGASIIIPLAYTPSLYWLAGLLLIISTSFQGFSTVFLEAYFPLLVRCDPLVKFHQIPAKSNGNPSDTSTRTKNSQERQINDFGQVIESVVLKTMPYHERANWVQMYNNVYGFATSFIFLSVGGGLISVVGNGIGIKEGVICATGVFWLIVGVIAIRYLNARPGPKLSHGTSRVIFFSWKKALQSFKNRKEIKHTFRFLASYFFFGGGMNTLGVVSALYLRDILQLSDFHTLTIGNLIPVFSILGSLACVQIQNKSHISTHIMLLVSVSMFALIPVYALIGAFTHTFGLVHAYEAYILSAWGGFFYGSSVAFTKVMYSELIPAGQECEFFGFYVLTDRVSTWLSSVIIGFIAQGTSARYGMIWLIVFFLVSLPLLWMVDLDQGRHDAKILSSGSEQEVVIMQDFVPQGAEYDREFPEQEDKNDFPMKVDPYPSNSQPSRANSPSPYAASTRSRTPQPHDSPNANTSYAKENSSSRDTLYTSHPNMSDQPPYPTMPTSIATSTAFRPPPSNYGTAGGSIRSDTLSTTAAKGTLPYAQSQVPAIQMPPSVHASSLDLSEFPYMENRPSSRPVNS
ncbi:hypothetical protein BATDEDRAFT_92427 [Batrachochytrium dendrobatidis JAM81]|uniref:Autophagy-related protein n=2 Tax=Batrachochytrium dendrobatidis TaxID=109871 RepID=F4PDA2_BATDJ|nr:uncharacterized protein BATDEDRAFT_92427 [Batrachochytrium dendrobatidis JAM81]EGF76755.1 hypothetical protein BATDEDRAFT_92427 [Batrachochytrium dendrobatidis JAM81]OAJ45313.1 hypothetical protein BDEG_28463 [Batrachochytrium dendrobatidis JEL423]|eukprot:XP_006682711.1 hypothetical protein BATDEDRAFT_92427 [Batrachochytrium dendrobatidis JAM81]